MIRQCVQSLKQATLTYGLPLRAVPCAATLTHTCATCTCRICTCPKQAPPLFPSVINDLKCGVAMNLHPTISNVQYRGLRTSAIMNGAKGVRKEATTINGRLFGVCVLERYPVIMPELAAWEKDYQEWSEEKQLSKRKELPKELVDTRYNEENAGISDWEPAPRITPDDTAMNMKSLNRALDKKLYLIVKSKDGQWHFPRLEHQAGETMRQTVDRVAATVAPKEEVFVLGNTPSGHFPIPEGDSVAGAKPGDALFYYRANYLANTFSLPAAVGAADYAWATNEEVWSKYFSGAEAEYMKELIQPPPMMAGG